MFTDDEVKNLIKISFKKGWETAVSAIKYGVMSEDNKETILKHYAYYEKECIISILEKEKL